MLTGDWVTTIQAPIMRSRFSPSRTSAKIDQRLALYFYEAIEARWDKMLKYLWRDFKVSKEPEAELTYLKCVTVKDGRGELSQITDCSRWLGKKLIVNIHQSNPSDLQH